MLRLINARYYTMLGLLLLWALFGAENNALAQGYYNRLYTNHALGSVFYAVCPQRGGNTMAAAMAVDSATGAQAIRISRISPRGVVQASAFFNTPAYPAQALQLAEGGITRIDANCFALAGIRMVYDSSAQQGFLALCDSNGMVYKYRELGIDFPAYEPFMWVAQVRYDGSHLVVLSHFSIAKGTLNQVLTKYDTALHTVWSRQYAEGDHPSKDAYNLLIDSNGYIVAGGSTSTFMYYYKNYKEQAVVFRTDTGGNLQWTYKSPGMMAVATHIAHSGDGGYVFSTMGNVYNKRAKDTAADADWRAEEMVVKLDGRGHEQWKLAYTPGQYVEMGSTSICVLSMPRAGFMTLHVHTDSPGLVSNLGYAELRYYSDSGKLLSQRRHLAPIDTPVYAKRKLYDLARMHDGALIIAGYVNNLKSDAIPPAQRSWLIRVDSNGCMGAGDPQCWPAGIGETSVQKAKINIYPNPSGNLFHCAYNLPGEAELQIIDMSGRVLLQRNLPPGSGEVLADARDWSPGLYLYRLNIKGQSVAYGKLLKY